MNVSLHPWAFVPLRILVATAMMVSLAPPWGTSHAADSPPVSATPGEATDLQPARAAIKAKKYDVALAQLKVLVVKYPTADVYSLLGHALWKTGDPQQGMAYYNKALAINPLHRGALEYQGELYVELKQIDKAKENLAKLKGVCPFSCEELSDLRESIEHTSKGS